ncbi:MAG TPA: BadF/BadG/BcrA/BcrD ATPase family protein [Candidatus Acidoferrales bacterium]|nr:BadF/BadG/BcrA/BcrD ATPase family protein [Candidatus Acidoferrales bacterium]
MSYYLGIDGGGTKTTCAVGDETKLLARATAGPSNIVRVGEAQARASLQESVRQACAAAGITPGQVVHTCAGGSGAARPELAAVVRRALAEILPTPVDVVGDIQIALEAAFDTGPGVIVIGGTGSIAYGRNSQGNTARAGGWGFAISDEGSAHWIGRSAVSAVLRAADLTDEGSEARIRLQNSSIVAALFKSWGVNSFADLARAANSIPPPDFATLFPPVAGSGDDLGAQVLVRAGRELAQLGVVVIRRLFAGGDAATVPVAMIGGVFRHAPQVREVFYNELRVIDARVEVNPQVVEPVEGALRLARRAARKVARAE